jgi:CheY-like chemotaxis protein
LSCVALKESPLTQTISVSVKDTGIGMDGSYVKSLFDKFSQEDVSVTRKYGGTGLGMSICKDLVELMGGQIIVESRKDVGTCVSFIIEFVKGTLNNLPAKDTFNFSKEVLDAKTILVVDDNKMNRLVAKTILGNYGAVVIEAVNGSEAIDLLAQPGIDVVLMDIHMPVMGGMEATEIIRKTISQTLPIIALTANAIKGDNEKYLEGGMSAYLSKPFKEFDLLNIVASSINKK